MISGFIPCFKPKGPSSAAIVGKVRRLLKIKKIGHSGTLDPAAEGVLVLALNRATSLIQYLPGPKAYRAKIRLGSRTSTLDAQGEVLEQASVPVLSKDQLLQVINKFEGTIEQIPPMVSALRVNGQRLYKLARQGKEIERQPRTVTIYGIRFEEYNDELLTITVDCSGGTYIRTLADDIGQLIGCGAHLEALTRTKCGGYSLDDVVNLDELEVMVGNGNWDVAIQPMDRALTTLPEVIFEKEKEQLIRYGQIILLPDNIIMNEQQPYRILNHERQLIGIGYKKELSLKMSRILMPVNEE